MANDQIFQYVLITANHQPIPEINFQQFSKAVSDHSEKHDFAQMIRQSDIRIKKISIKDVEYEGIFIPFTKERFEELTALNWYLKTLTAKYDLMMFQLIMPDGSLIGM